MRRTTEMFTTKKKFSIRMAVLLFFAVCVRICIASLVTYEQSVTRLHIGISPTHT